MIDGMLRRLCALAFTVVFAVAPVVATLCQTVCAMHEHCGASAAPAPSAHAHHHHDGTAAATAGALLQQYPHACDHRPDDAIGVQQALRLLGAPAYLPLPVYAIAPAALVQSPERPADATSSPPDPLALTRQLRV